MLVVCRCLSHLWTSPSQGLKASAGFNRAISDFLMTLHGTCLSGPTWLLQCLRYQHGSCFVSPVLQFCSLVMPCNEATQAQSMCHIAYVSGGIRFCCCSQTKQIINLINMLVDFALNIFTTLFWYRGVGAL